MGLAPYNPDGYIIRISENALMRCVSPVSMPQGCVAALDEDEDQIELTDDRNITLHCPSILGLAGKYTTEFGRGMRTPRLRHMCGKV